MRRLAHRGRVHDWPENTIASLPSALALTDGVEVDVRLSADGVPILMHDSEVDRTTDGTGAVDALTKSELSQLSVGGRAPIPTLHDYIAAAMRLGASLILLDVKDPTPAALAATVEVVSGASRVEVLLAVRSDEALSELRGLAPTAQLASLGVTVDDVHDRIANGKSLGVDVLFIHHGDRAYQHHRAAVATIRAHGLLAGASTLCTVRAVDLAEADGCGYALVDLPLTTSEESS